MDFDQRVRRIVNPLLEDLYRLHQDAPEPRGRGMAGSLEPQVLNRLEELKQEVREIADAVGASTIEDGDDSEEKRKQLKKMIEDFLEPLIDIVDANNDGDFDFADVVKHIYNFLGKAGILGDKIMQLTLPPLFNAITQGKNKNDIIARIYALKGAMDTASATVLKKFNDIEERLNEIDPDAERWTDLWNFLTEQFTAVLDGLTNLADCCVTLHTKVDKMQVDVDQIKRILTTGVTVQSSPVINDVYQKILASSGEGGFGQTF